MQATAETLYRQREGLRSPYLNRAREASKLTLPSLIPPEGSTGSTELPTPFQGLGARGVNNLASKLLLALLPPNSPFFRLMVDDYSLEAITQQEGMRAEVEKALGSIERAVQTDIETSAVRVTASEILKHLVVGGNGLLYVPPAGNPKFFRLDRFVVQRDPMGNTLDIIVKESISPVVLPQELQASVGDTDRNPDKTVDIYTRIVRGEKEWAIHQEVKGTVIPGTEGTYPLDKCPWIPLRLTKIDGEDYGRGYVEEYIGDLKSLEGLTRAIVEGSAAAAKVLFLLDPNGLTQAKTLTESPNGAVRAGRKEDVTVLQVEKFADFRVALETIGAIESRLSYAFLLNSAVQRGGERVTAEEIRYMAQELEDALGGVYSILSQEFQLPLVRAHMNRLEKAKKIPALPKGVVRPSITTGIEALGRGHDLNKLDTFLGGIAQTFGPEALAQRINLSDYLTRRGTALGIDMKGLVKTEEQVQEEQAAAMEAQQQAMLGQMAAQGGMSMAQEVVKGAMKQ